MHYNIALLPKKVTNYIIWLLLMESNAIHYFCVIFTLLFKYKQGLIVCFNTIIYIIYSKCKSHFTPKTEMNKPQAEVRVKHVCTVERRRRRFNTPQQQKNNEVIFAY